MFCPYCGREFGSTGSRFCPFCGQDLAPTVTLTERLSWIQMFRVLSPSEGGTKYRAMIVGGFAIIIAMALAIVFIFATSASTPTAEEPELPTSDLIIVIDENSQVTLSGDFSTGVMCAYQDSSGNIVIYLDNSTSNGYSKFMWVLRDDQKNVYNSITKDSAEISWLEPRVGQFTVIVYCYEGDDEVPATSYSGTMLYRGDKKVSHQWEYDGKKFSISSTVSMQDILKYSDTSIVSQDARSGKDPNAFLSFVVTDGTVADIQSKLSSTYERYYGQFKVGSYGYADFVLSFVQSISFAYDSMNYYQSDYWAFPAEMLFNECGDEEDHAILYTSIMRAAGYDCGLMVLPGSTISAISVDGIPESLEAPDGYGIGYKAYGGKIYVMADANSYNGAPLSTIRDCYEMDSQGNFLYYGTLYKGDYGLYL